MIPRPITFRGLTECAHKNKANSKFWHPVSMLSVFIWRCMKDGRQNQCQAGVECTKCLESADRVSVLWELSLIGRQAAQMCLLLYIRLYGDRSDGNHFSHWCLFHYRSLMAQQSVFVLLEEEVIVSGEIITILLEEKLPNARLTFHLRRHSELLFPVL